MSFDTLLIANRGEIAVRIARSARRMGLRAVAVHSTADAGAPHVAACDLAVEIGPPEAARSYLDGPRIIRAARATGAGAIHPGYGFLAENAGFAQACADAGIVFVGPSPYAIGAMGDKAAAKRLMRAAGVPVVPGYDGEEQGDERLLAEAQGIGFPLMVKAAAGGGGKGMRLVHDAATLPDALAGARRESRSAFGSDELLLERAVVRPRHVEIQVLADTHAHCLHLGERDCSVQRRHQKVIEESPSPAVDAALRARMGAAGVAAAQAVDYVGAGTIEFLLDSDGEFYFLEMNTRLQVEHPVTELVTGLDLVEWQLRIARGEHLELTQDQVTMTGHAIEARLYAEDPDNDYLPATGTVARWEAPAGEGIRVDAGIVAGSTITPYYDPMIAKVIAHGDDREQARTRLVRTLEETTVLGPVTNRTLLVAMLRTPEFAAGAATTAFLEEHPPRMPAPTSGDVAAIAAWLYDARRREADRAAPGLAGWSSTGALDSRRRYAIGETIHAVSVHETPGAVEILVGDEGHAVTLDGETPIIDGDARPLRGVELAAGQILVSFDRLDLEIRDVGALPPGALDAIGGGVLVAPMHGKVIAVDAELGAAVVDGQRLVVMEAMKMEHEIVADGDGVLEEIVGDGAQVAAGQVLARIALEETAA
ncbi:MAG TPA: acetyl-CoA carboxylase biotin carboxylase subunit [Solirubrobacteraceae bacterium]|jgi:geranyl-CoA carboxylase alpha subunit|nr:acetyl-CoA carboxylase biotin carboxylase subunit [Solirubrobacteraceae bacterium]